MTPYLAYWVPEHLGGSGVLATVAAGLYVSWNGPRLISSATRLQGIFFWDLIIYLIEGFVFLLTGLQARTLIEKAHDFPIRELLVATALTTADRDRGAFHLGVSGDLSAALAQPVAGETRSVAAVAESLHDRLHRRARRGLACRRARHSIDARQRRSHFRIATAILFVTFGVIIITLVGHGLMLPLVVRWIGLTRLGREERAGAIQSELDARISALDEVEKRLEKFVEERELPDEVITLLRTRNQSRRQVLPSDLSDGLEQTRQSVALKKELIDAERDFIYQLLREGKITDEARRRIEYELDLEEAGVANRGKDGGGWF